MTLEQQLENLMKDETMRIEQKMSLVSQLASQKIFSDNGLTNDQKIETQKVFNDLLNRDKSTETLKRAHELMKQYEGR